MVDCVGASPFVKASTFFLPYGIACVYASGVCVCVCVYACERAYVRACVCAMRVRVHARVKTSKNPPETQKNTPPRAKKKSFSICDVTRNMYI